MCVCVCVRARARDRGRENSRRKTQIKQDLVLKKKKSEIGKCDIILCVCRPNVCVCVNVV